MDIEGVALVPIEYDSRRDNPQYSARDEQFEECRDADTEDINCCQNEKKAGYAASHRYVVH